MIPDYPKIAEICNRKTGEPFRFIGVLDIPLHSEFPAKTNCLAFRIVQKDGWEREFAIRFDPPTHWHGWVNGAWWEHDSLGGALNETMVWDPDPLLVLAIERTILDAFEEKT